VGLLRRRRRRERSVYFPWERRGLAFALAWPRRGIRVALVFALLCSFAWAIQARASRARGVRITRAAIAHTRAAVDLYRADHGGLCPRDLQELVTPAERVPYLAALPLDAWQRPLRFGCPSRDPARAYDLLSDGPDGEPHGLDRIE
jgi:hypothetical protein